MGMGSSNSRRSTESAAQRSNAATGSTYPAYSTQQYNQQYPGAAGGNISAPPRMQPGPPPPQVQATYTIRNEMNVNKNSLALVQKGDLHCLRFNFDTETEGSLRVLFGVTEGGSSTDSGAKKIEWERQLGPQHRFAKALAQPFEQEGHDGLNLGSLSETQITKQELPGGATVYPFAVLLEKEQGPGIKFASQTTFAEIRKDPSDGSWLVRPLKQKIQIGDASYELQEIYGIELHEKAAERAAGNGESAEGSECVICMTNPRDTTVLPCRHMCMCASCAKVLRVQSSKCPVCREQVSSLLQIKVQEDTGAQ